jgi:hypothetical protein
MTYMNHGIVELVLTNFVIIYYLYICLIQSDDKNNYRTTCESDYTIRYNDIFVFN